METQRSVNERSKLHKLSGNKILVKQRKTNRIKFEVFYDFSFDPSIDSKTFIFR